MIKEFLKWFLNKIMFVIILCILIFIIPFIMFLQINTIYAVIWFVLCECIIPAFIAWYVVEWKKESK